MKLPECLMVGVAKSGTTSLAYYLSQLSFLELAEGKEAHYFDSDERYAQGIDYYVENFFGGAAENKIWLDATPGYFQNGKKTIPRIRSTYGETSPKFILILRDPIQRAISHYKHKRRNDQEGLSFSDAIEYEIKYGPKSSKKWANYLHDGLYGQQLKNWLGTFSLEQFLIIKQSDLSAKPELVIQKVVDFLGGGEVDFSSLMLHRKNQASVPRYAWLNKCLNVSFPFIPSHIKRKYFKELGPKLRTKIRKLNLKVSDTSDDVKLTDKDIQLMKEFYRTDLALLERLTRLNFDEWK